MGLIYRDGRPYLYRSIRRAGRVTSEYRGSGECALLINALETIERDDRDFDRWRERSERRELDILERALDELAERARDLARDALSTAGYHQHRRGEWRKRRVSRHREGEARRADHGRLGGRPIGRMGCGEGRQRDHEGEAQARALRPRRRAGRAEREPG